MRLGKRKLPTLVFTLLFAITLLKSFSTSAAAEPTRLYVTIDRSEVIQLPQGLFTKVSVTNPAIADVVVITPNQILVNGKATGVTSLLVFYPNRIEHFDLVVYPAPAVTEKVPLVPSEAHTVMIQRADKITSHLFAPNKARVWVEVGVSKAESEAAKK